MSKGLLLSSLYLPNLEQSLIEDSENSNDFMDSCGD